MHFVMHGGLPALVRRTIAIRHLAIFSKEPFNKNETKKPKRPKNFLVKSHNDGGLFALKFPQSASFRIPSLSHHESLVLRTTRVD